MGWLLAILAVSALGLAMLISAARDSRPAAAPRAPVAHAAVLPAATSAAPEPAGPPVLSVHFAVFRRDALNECLDVEARLASEATLPKAIEMLATLRGKNPDIGRPCSEQFADRTPLARCTLLKPSSKLDGAQLHMVATYFLVDTVVDSDRYMRECLADGGQWWSADRNDTDAARERIRQRARKIMKLGESIAEP